MDLNSLQNLMIHQLRNLYSAEHQIAEALPRMAEKASNEQLRGLLEEHHETTRRQTERLERIFQDLDEKPAGQRSRGVEGLIAEGNELLERTDIDADVRDAGLIAAQQRIEHFEMAEFGAVRTYAEMLGKSEWADLLQQSLDEVKLADKRLTEIAKSSVNREAMTV